MNIKEHIIAGHYPLDEKGRALVPHSEGGHVVVLATDGPGAAFSIVGWRLDAAGDYLNLTRWLPDAHCLLPPSPRKVTLRFVARINGGLACYCQPDTPGNRQEALVRQREYGGHVVTLTGEYEEPWS